MDAWEYIHEERYRPRPGQEPDKPIRKSKRAEVPVLPASFVDDEVSIRRRRRELADACTGYEEDPEIAIERRSK